MWCYSLIFICHGLTHHGHLWAPPGQAADKISRRVMQCALSVKRLFPCINVTQRLYPANSVFHHGAITKHLRHMSMLTQQNSQRMNMLLNHLFKRKPGQLSLRQGSDLSALVTNLLRWQPTLPKGRDKFILTLTGTWRTFKLWLTEASSLEVRHEVMLIGVTKMLINVLHLLLLHVSAGSI